MKRKISETLLPLTRFFLWAVELFLAAFGFSVVVGGVIIAVAVLMGLTDTLSKVLIDMPKVSDGLLALGVFGFGALFGGGLLSMWQFVCRMRHIVETVGTDPFIRANAKRLRQMAWLGLLSFLCLTSLIGFSHLFAELAEKQGQKIHVEGQVDVSLIVIGLFLFVLARVFDYGADMREELEGTV